MPSVAAADWPNGCVAVVLRRGWRASAQAAARAQSLQDSAPLWPVYCRLRVVPRAFRRAPSVLLRGSVRRLTWVLHGRVRCAGCHFRSGGRVQGARYIRRRRSAQRRQHGVEFAHGIGVAPSLLQCVRAQHARVLRGDGVATVLRQRQRFAEPAFGVRIVGQRQIHLAKRAQHVGMRDIVQIRGGQSLLCQRDELFRCRALIARQVCARGVCRRVRPGNRARYWHAWLHAVPRSSATAPARVR